MCTLIPFNLVLYKVMQKDKWEGRDLKQRIGGQVCVELYLGLFP